MAAIPWHRRVARSATVRTLLAIYACALLVRAVAALLIDQPGFTDSFYYYHVASNLYAGRGFVEDFIWNYLHIPSTVTHPSNAYWGPLASVIIVPSFWLFGLSFRASQVPMVLISASLPLVTYVTAVHLGCTRRQALVATTLTIFSGVYLIYSTVPEGYVPFAVAGAVALLAGSKSLDGSPRYAFVAGLASGLAQLSRSDGLLLIVTLLGIVLFRIINRRQDLDFRRLVYLAVVLTLGYAIVMLPWLYRMWLEFGSPLFNPGGKTIFLKAYNDVFTFGGKLDASYYLGAGIAHVLSSKLLAVGRNLQVLGEAIGYYLAPIVASGLWSYRKTARARAFFVYAILLYAAMTFAFTLPGQLGSLLHSAAALLPFLMVSSVVGLDRSVSFLVNARPNLSPEVLSRLCTVLLICSQVVLTGGLLVVGSQQWDTRYSYALYPQAITWLQSRLRDDEPVMVMDPAAYNYYSGSPAIVVPNNDFSTLARIATQYGVRFVLLEPAHPMPLDALYKGNETHDELGLRLELRNGRNQELKVYELNN